MKQLVGIIGGGESGVGAALLAKREGFEVFLSDFGTIKENYKKVLIQNQIPFEEEGHDFERFKRAFLVIKSPGVPGEAPIVQYLARHQILVISEIEFASRFYDGAIIAITGSNGKTTTAGLIFHLLNNAGLDVGLSGNIGNSFAAEIVKHKPKKFMVLEISNFQLDDIVDFNPHIAVVLNITPDHLDRYNYNFNLYVHSKFRIIENQTKSDYFIYNADDPVINEKLISINKRQNFKPIYKTDYLDGLKTIDELDKFTFNLLGEHNLFNARVVIEIARIIGLSEEHIQKGLKSFSAVPHRLEWIRTIGSVKFINDSKATNIDAVYYALKAIDEKIIWIVGGVDKGNDYSIIEDLVVQKVKRIICLGIDNKKLISSFTSKVEHIIETQSMSEAVKLAHLEAENNDVVLLSPACASFDLFDNYEDRGKQFENEVSKL